MGKTRYTERIVTIPEDVELKVSARSVTVTGPRGTLTRGFKHIPCEMTLEGDRLTVGMWWAHRQMLACLRTVTAHIENMMTGVTKGFLYKLRLAYAHFPINATITGKDKDVVELRNFLGQRRMRTIQLRPGVTIRKSEDVKDQLELEGNDLEAVSGSAALIHSACLVRAKDIRKFLDGAYVNEKGAIGELVQL